MPVGLFIAIGLVAGVVAVSLCVDFDDDRDPWE